jgi:hypothetical protein
MAAVAGLICAGQTASFAQTQQTGSEQADPGAPERIDILIPEPADQQLASLCDDQEEAATISGEIVVCRRIRKDSPYRYSERGARDNRTRQEQIDNFGLPRGLPADFAGAGIFRGPATAGGGCLPGSCPPPMPELIDLKAIPEAPPGSDADRIGRGLPPLGNDGEVLPEAPQKRAQFQLREPLASPPAQTRPASNELANTLANEPSIAPPTTADPISEEELGLPSPPDFKR